jgi:DNA end-binding protein Ku
MAARANWKGYLKLSLVSCAVALFPAASSSARVRFNTLNRETGNRVKRLFVDAVTEEPVDSEDQVKGYEVGRGSYVLVEDEEIEAIRIDSTHTIDVESFVPRAEVDVRFLDAPYYIAPDDKVAQEAFAVIRDAMRKTGKVGVARVVMARRERILLIEPFEKGLLATTLRYPYEVRDAGAYFDDIPDIDYPAEMADLAAHIVEKKSGRFDPDSFEDRYENAVVALVRAKQAGEGSRQEPSAPERPSNVVNLMDALKRSIEAEKSTGAGEKAGGKSAAKRNSAKSETGRPAHAGKTAPAKKAAARKAAARPLKKAS